MHHVTSCKAIYLRVYACLTVTCHLHFWQNDRDLLRATAVTRGWNGYRNKSQRRKSTLEKKLLPPLLYLQAKLLASMFLAVCARLAVKGAWVSISVTVRMANRRTQDVRHKYGSSKRMRESFLFVFKIRHMILCTKQHAYAQVLFIERKIFTIVIRCCGCLCRKTNTTIAFKIMFSVSKSYDSCHETACIYAQVLFTKRTIIRIIARCYGCLCSKTNTTIAFKIMF